MSKKFIIASFCLMLVLNLITADNNIYGKTITKNTKPKYTSSYNTLKNKKPFLANRGGYVTCLTMTAAAYSAKKGAGTASGLPAAVGHIAVDPRVIPLGTKLYIQSLDGSKDYGYAIAADTGTAIKGKYIDLFFNTYKESCQWGLRNVKVYILSK